jgi:hypothetical protein
MVDKDIYCLSNADLLTMINLFQGRENSYARQWVSDEGKYGYTPVNEPLNLNAVRNHLLGIQTLGIYQLDFMGKVKWIVFDLDVEKSHLDKLIKPEEDSIRYYLLCKNCARNIAISGLGTYTEEFIKYLKHLSYSLPVKPRTG